MKKVYLDYNATTPLDPTVREAMLPFLGDAFGNPSSLHSFGARARQAIDEAREKVAREFGCLDREIVFTSGGSESINLAIKGVVLAARGQRAAAVGGSPPGRSHVITSAVEHQAVLQSCDTLEREGLAEVTRLPVDQFGEIDCGELERSIRKETMLISVMFANNETGNLYPINRIGEIARARGILFHTDAVQAVGKVPVDLKRLPVDLLSFSAHKFYGPKGVGALFVRKGVKISRLIDGGAQEGERRGGTENVAGIVGLAEALVRVNRDLDSEARRLARLRDHLQEALLEVVPSSRVRGSPQSRIPNTLNVTFEGVTSEAILIALDREGIAVSSGSACASGTTRPSHVLLAMGVPPGEAKGAVRFSLGCPTTDSDIDSLLEKLPAVVERLRG